MDEKVTDMDYKVIVTQKADQYILYISELQLTARGNNLDSAYKELNQKKAEQLKEFKEAGLQVSPPLPNLPSEENAMRRKDIGVFTIKTLIACFLLILVINFTGNKVNNLTKIAN